MRVSYLEPNVIAVLFLGVAVPILGLLALLMRPSPRRRLAVAAATLGLVVLAGGLALAGQPQGFWLPPALLALLCGVSLALRSQQLGQVAGRLIGVLRQPWLHAAVLVAAGPALAFGWITWTDPNIPNWDPPAEIKEAHEQVNIQTDEACQPLTDAGRPVRMYRPIDPPPPTKRLLEIDAALVSALELSASLIRTAPPTQDYNCHGWVFTGGRGWIQGSEVDEILRDNGYYGVDDPRPGDVVIYRGFNGAIAHSGVVRTAWSGGPVLIESKWGKGGRFLSAPDAPPYGPATYYRSPRRGNHLRGLGAEDSETTTAVGTAAILTN
jgi:hypothetical protein